MIAWPLAKPLERQFSHLELFKVAQYYTKAKTYLPIPDHSTIYAELKNSNTGMINHPIQKTGPDWYASYADMVNVMNMREWARRTKNLTRGQIFSSRVRIFLN